MTQLRCTVLIIALLASLASCWQKPKPDSPEQTSFCEDGIAGDARITPVDVPPIVLTLLMKTDQVREAKALAKNTGAQMNPASGLKGQHIQVSDTGGPFFVVMGQRSVSGADHAWFWIVREDRNDDVEKARILLFAGGNCLNLDANKTRGYRDVLMTWSSRSETITNTYIFNGKEYKIKKTSSRPKR